MNDEKEHHEKLLALIRDTIQQDIGLREKYQVGEKFRFVLDRMHALLKQIEENTNAVSGENPDEVKEDTSNDVLVFVYLYNAQGLVVRTWNTLMVPKVFYEYSVNRPIYLDKNHIESLIRGKSNRMQHGYLTIAVNRDHIIVKEDQEQKDALGNPVVKVKEGSLHFNKLVAFTHNEVDYVLNPQGELVKKA